jgi:Uma2 family endonuclease
MASLPNPILTEEQYLRLEREAAVKSEFHDGQMFAMAGGSPNHSLLANRIGALLDRAIPSACRTFNSDLQIRIAYAGVYTYADCTVLCGEPEFSGDALINPDLIVEVLPPSTEAYDRGRKFELYRGISSLREYLLIHQDRVHVEHYSKQEDGSWLLRDFADSDAMLNIPRLGVRIALADLYKTALGLSPTSA